jgi:hypothetical protein
VELDEEWRREKKERSKLLIICMNFEFWKVYFDFWGKWEELKGVEEEMEERMKERKERDES